MPGIHTLHTWWKGQAHARKKPFQGKLVCCNRHTKQERRSSHYPSLGAALGFTSLPSLIGPCSPHYFHGIHAANTNKFITLAGTVLGLQEPQWIALTDKRAPFKAEGQRFQPQENHEDEKRVGINDLTRRAAAGLPLPYSFR